MMMHFRDFRKDCVFRNQSICSYWEKSTECHVLAGPFHSQKLALKMRKTLQKQVQDQVTFNPEDFDKIGSSVQDIIEKRKSENGSLQKSDLYTSKTSTVTEKSISRMHCIACGELITDDKFITIRDHEGVLIYLHSKGKCNPRHDQIKIVRDRWLKVRQRGETVNDSQETESLR